MCSAVVLLPVEVSRENPADFSASASAVARCAAPLPFRTTTAMFLRGVASAGGAAGALEDGAAGGGEEGAVAAPDWPALSDWSFLIDVNSFFASGPATSRFSSFGSASVCMVVKVTRAGGTLLRSSARPTSLVIPSRPGSTVSALVAASASDSTLPGSVSVPALFS